MIDLDERIKYLGKRLDNNQESFDFLIDEYETAHRRLAMEHDELQDELEELLEIRDEEDA